MKLTSLYQISKYTTNEIFLEQQIMLSGTNQARVMEKLESDANYIKSTSLLIKIVVAIYIVMLILIPIQTLRMIQLALQSGASIQWIMFLGALNFVLFFLLQVFLLTLFELFFAVQIFQTEAFRWLQNFEIEKKDIRKIIILTVIRQLDIPLILMFFVLPLGILIITANIGMVFLAILCSGLNMIFSVSFVIFFGARMSHLFAANSTNTKKANFLRILNIIIYFLALCGILVLIQFLPAIMEPFFLKYQIHPIYESLNTYLPIIFFPVNSAYLLVLSFVDQPLSTIQLIMLLLGMLFSVIFAYLASKFTLKKMDILLNEEKGIKNDEETPKIESIQVKSTSEVKAFYRKDQQAAAHDIGVLTWILIPFIYGLFVLYMINISEDFIFSFIYMEISLVMMVVGILRLERQGTDFLGGLPFNVRDQVKAKFIWLYWVLPVSYGLPLLVFFKNPLFLYYLFGTLIWLPLGPLNGILFILLKVRLFGKLKHGFTIDEVKKNQAALKWTVLVAIQIGFIVLFIFTTTKILQNYSLGIYALIYLPVEVLYGGILYYLFNRMFPKA